MGLSSIRAGYVWSVQTGHGTPDPTSNERGLGFNLWAIYTVYIMSSKDKSAMEVLILNLKVGTPDEKNFRLTFSFFLETME